ncbi:hypothetical protein UFOVP346_2 [uncultured Caudovirales phage]|uniref:Uncharacterized protein n=1 Tax=uncultured Caudovirales phage TaxID=2100421 RepID=A0A6J5LYF4_9CAUD|nr:hypothetical protein UFOVP346_2 [uncultured Caudovirales phage]
MTASLSVNPMILTSDDTQYIRINGRLVVLGFDWPPIPLPYGPHFYAYFEDEVELGGYGYGPTPERALEDLMENLEYCLGETYGSQRL